MARGTIVTRAGALTSSRPLSLRSPVPGNGSISLRPIKEFAQKLSANHPLRIVLMGEPDEIGRGEFLVKLTVWLRLLPNDGQ